MFYAGADVKASHLQLCNLDSGNAVHKGTCNQSTMKVLIAHFSVYTKRHDVACSNGLSGNCSEIHAVSHSRCIN
jgi:ribulose-5-phosphate 4-epimerase/fuculose-1-phosphate aldolase